MENLGKAQNFRKIPPKYIIFVVFQLFTELFRAAIQNYPFSFQMNYVINVVKTNT